MFLILLIIIPIVVEFLSKFYFYDYYPNFFLNSSALAFNLLLSWKICLSNLIQVMSDNERSYDEVWDSMWENEASDDEAGKTLSDNGSPGDEPLSKKRKLAVIFFYLLIL